MLLINPETTMNCDALFCLYLYGQIYQYTQLQQGTYSDLFHLRFFMYWYYAVFFGDKHRTWVCMWTQVNQTES